jgi:hypothetical protein
VCVFFFLLHAIFGGHLRSLVRCVCVCVYVCIHVICVYISYIYTSGYMYILSLSLLYLLHVYTLLCVYIYTHTYIYIYIYIYLVSQLTLLTLLGHRCDTCKFNSNTFDAFLDLSLEIKKVTFTLLSLLSSYFRDSLTLETHLLYMLCMLALLSCTCCTYLLYLLYTLYSQHTGHPLNALCARDSQHISNTLATH